ncbi:MAG TPA: hypothetical protein VND64_27540 [Pirellulales bacterium]|nr:hypothetical protein [Pirellulales bacterium]
MRRFITAAIVACLALSAIAYAAKGAAPNPKAKALLKWNGTWALSEDLNRALGFTDAESRADGRLGDNHPVSFQLTLTETIGEGSDEHLVQSYRDNVFKRNGHRIVATGKWKLTFRENTDIDASDCFVTEYEGATFLWVPANWVIIFGGKLSLLEGRDNNHDVIVIDFNSDPHDERSVDTAAYQRKA